MHTHRRILAAPIALALLLGVGISISDSANAEQSHRNDTALTSVVRGTQDPITTIMVGAAPGQPAVSTSSVFVPNAGSKNISVISRSTNTVASTISVGSAPTGAILVGDRVYVALAHSIAVINASTAALETEITVGASPRLPVPSADGKQLLVANATDGTVSVIETATNIVKATITVGTNPMRPAYGTGPNSMYAHLAYVPNSVDIPNANQSSVSVIDLNTLAVVDTIAVTGPLSDAIATLPNAAGSDLMFVTSKQGGSTSVTAISQGTNKVESHAPLDGDDTPYVGTLSKDGATLYVPGGGFISAQTTSKLYAEVIAEPAAFTKGNIGPGAMSADGQWMLFTSPDKSYFHSTPFVSLLNTATNTLTAMIHVGNRPESLAWAPDGAYAYVSNAGDGTVSAINFSTSFWPSAPRKATATQVKQKMRPMTTTVKWKAPKRKAGLNDYWVQPTDTEKYCKTKKFTCTVKNLSPRKGYDYNIRARSDIAIGEGIIAKKSTR